MKLVFCNSLNHIDTRLIVGIGNALQNNYFCKSMRVSLFHNFSLQVKWKMVTPLRDWNSSWHAVHVFSVLHDWSQVYMKYNEWVRFLVVCISLRMHAFIVVCPPLCSTGLSLLKAKSVYLVVACKYFLCITEIAHIFYSGYFDCRRAFQTVLNSYCCVTGWTQQTKNRNGCFTLRYNWGARNYYYLSCYDAECVHGFISRSVNIAKKS